jgi:hypothetical protein
MRKKAGIFLFLACSLTFASSECLAIPNYARNLKVDCSMCHSIRPQLNPVGRRFLLSGGEVLNTDVFAGVELSTDFLGGRLRSEWVDKRFSSDSKTEFKDETLRIRPISSGQAFLSGRADKAFYYSLIESDTDLDVELARAYILYPLTSNVLIYGGYASPFAIDGYDTVRHRPVLRRDWSAAGFAPGTAQMIGIHGSYRNFSGMASVHGDDNDSRGREPKSLSLRTTYSLSPSHALGAYFTRGRRFDEAIDKANDKYRFYGVDATFHFGPANLLFVAALRNEEGRRDDNISMEFSYTFPLREEGLIKAIIPVVSLDTFTRELTNDGRFVQGAIGAVFRITHWFRFIPSVEGTLKAPSDFQHKDLRVAVIGDLAF